MNMKYEEFKKEVERVLLEKGKPTSWSEIRNSSDKLDQSVPYHGYVQKLHGEIGLIEIKDRKSGKKLWALRRWLKNRKQTFLAPPKAVQIILLCKAKEQFSKKLKMLTHCTAGVDMDWKWKRLYPLSAKVGAQIQKWDIIEASVKEFSPESNRPETVKIWPTEVKGLGRIEDMQKRRKIINRVIESGEFLHRNSWKGKTLGLIKPVRPKFFIDRRTNEVKCRFYCNRRECRGHTAVVWDCEITEQNYRIIPTKETYFLLGTHKYHPHRWLLISVITLAKSIPQTHLKSFILY